MNIVMKVDDNMNTLVRQLEIEREKEIEQEEIKKAKSSPFKKFYQVNKEMTKERLWLIGKYPRAYQILVFMESQMDNYNALIASYKVFQEALDVSLSTVTRSIRILREHNFINIYKSGTANVYVINKRLSWNSWGTNYKYAKFDAKIILSESEQDKICKSNDIETMKTNIVNIKDKQ